MNMKTFFKLLLPIFLTGHLLFAGDYSYIFIQGDKQTPFYVKLEGQMMPRLGKNYCILPNLDEGAIHLEILFQQNVYPPQKFTVKVPAASGRGLILQQINDQQFALYDLQTKHHLVAGNKEEDDQLDATVTEDDQKNLAWGNTTAEDIKPVTDKEPELPEFNSKKQAKKKRSKEETSGDGRFISDIELNRDAVPAFDAKAAAMEKTGTAVIAGENVPDEDAKPVKKKKKAKEPVITEEDESLYEGSTVFTDEAAALKKGEQATEEVGNREGVSNSDCPAAMSNDAFEDFAIRLMEKSDDDAQLKYLRKTNTKNCYTTEQVRILAKNMETQSARFETVKLLYPRVVDQSNYSVLENLFNTSYLKSKFKEIITP